MKEFQVIAGVIDQEYKGEIKIMDTATKDRITIDAYQQVAHLVLLPLLHSEHKNIIPTSGCIGFGSSDIYCVTQIEIGKASIKYLD